MNFLSSCRGKEQDEEEEEDQKVSPPGDLMQEHGLLNRILLIYDTCRLYLEHKEAFNKKALLDAVTIVRTFVEDYHEKQEENYRFPRFQKAGELTDLVAILLQQQQYHAPQGKDGGNSLIKQCGCQFLFSTILPMSLLLEG